MEQAIHPIIQAIEEDNFELFLSLAQQNPQSLLEKDLDGWNLLPLSIQYNMPEFTQFLLDNLSAEDIENSQPAHPFVVAMENKNFSAANMVMSNSKIPVDRLFKSNDTALHYSTYFDDDTLTQTLLSRNANPFLKNKQNNSPLIQSLTKSDLTLFKHMAKHESFKSSFEDSWIKNSIKYNHREAFDTLYPYYKGEVDELFNVALGFEKIELIAALLDTGDFIPGMEQITEIVQLMCQKYDNPNEQNASIEVADFLFSIGIPFKDFVNNKGQSAWMLSIENDNEVLFERLINETKETVNNLDDQKHSPLMYAIDKNKPEFVLKLLKRKANPNQKDHNKDTPLIKAVRKGNVEIINHLLKYPVQVNELNNNGENALSLAIHLKRMDIVDKLIWAGGEITTNPAKFVEQNDIYQIGLSGALEKTYSSTDTKEINNFIALVHLGFKLTNKNEDGDTLLLHFIKEGYVANFHALLKCTRNANEIDKNGNTPLMCAMKKHTDDYAFSLLHKVPNMDLNIKNLNNESVYDLCINSAKVEILELLLKYDTTLTADNAQKSLFFLAQHGKLENSWPKIKEVLPNLEFLKDSNNNSLLMLATLGENTDNFNFLMTQEQVNFSSKHCNNDNDTLAQLIQKLPEDTLLEYTQILSKYLSVNKKRP